MNERSQLLRWFDEETAYIDACLSMGSQRGEVATASSGNHDERWIEVLYTLCLSGQPALAFALATIEHEFQREIGALKDANERLEDEIARTGRRIPLTTERLKKLREWSDRMYDLWDRRDRLFDEAAAWLENHSGAQ